MKERQKKAIDYAIEQIKASPLYPYVDTVYLYGSCARGEEKWDSDVDIFIQLKEEYREHPEMRYEMLMLISIATSPEVRDAEADVKIVVGDRWKSDNGLYYQNVRRDGIVLLSSYKDK